MPGPDSIQTWFGEYEKETLFEAGFRDVTASGNGFDAQQKIFRSGILDHLGKIRDGVFE